MITARYGGASSWIITQTRGSRARALAFGELVGVVMTSRPSMYRYQMGAWHERPSRRRYERTAMRGAATNRSNSSGSNAG